MLTSGWLDVVGVCYYEAQLNFYVVLCVVLFLFCFFFQAEDGIRDLVRSRGLGDVYKRQTHCTQGKNGRWPSLAVPILRSGPQQLLFSIFHIGWKLQLLSLIHI